MNLDRHVVQRGRFEIDMDSGPPNCTIKLNYGCDTLITLSLSDAQLLHRMLGIVLQRGICEWAEKR